MIHTMKRLVLVSLAGIVGILAGCGGGGGGGGAVTPPATTKVAGTASKGVIFPGTVKVFAVDTATGKAASTPLQSGQTDNKGQFSIDIGAYTGPVVVEVVGTYTDEATKQTVVMNTPMRAALASVSSTKRIAVTPLTELAYNLAGPSSLSVSGITAANARVSSLFKISDITAIEPVEPNAAILGSAGTTPDQQAYTLALATLSQMASNNSPGATPDFSQIAALIASFTTDLGASPTAVLSNASINDFARALGTVTDPNTGPLPGFTTALDALSSVGRPTIKLTLSASGTLPTGTLVGGISGIVTFPSGARMRVDTTTDNGQVLPGLISTTGSAASSLASGRFASPALTFAIINANGFSTGDFATILADIVSGSSVAADFSLTNVKVIDTGGVELGGISVTIK